MIRKTLTMRVAGKTDCKMLATTIFQEFHKDKHMKLELAAIGAGAISQMTKAIAIARCSAIGVGIDLVIRPCFSTATIEGREVTAMRFDVMAAD